MNEYVSAMFGIFYEGLKNSTTFGFLTSIFYLRDHQKLIYVSEVKNEKLEA